MNRIEFLTTLARLIATDPDAKPRLTSRKLMLRIGKDCPLTYVCRKETGRRFKVHEGWDAACAIGITERWLPGEIMSTADNQPSYLPDETGKYTRRINNELREALLAACGFNVPREPSPLAVEVVNESDIR